MSSGHLLRMVLQMHGGTKYPSFHAAHVLQDWQKSVVVVLFQWHKIVDFARQESTLHLVLWVRVCRAQMVKYHLVTLLLVTHAPLVDQPFVGNVKIVQREEQQQKTLHLGPLKAFAKIASLVITTIKQQVCARNLFFLRSTFAFLPLKKITCF